MASQNPSRDRYARGIPSASQRHTPSPRTDLSAREVLAGPTARPFAVCVRDDETRCPSGVIPAPTAIDGDAGRMHWLKLVLWAASHSGPERGHHVQLVVPATVAGWLAETARRQGMSAYTGTANARGAVTFAAWRD